MLSGRSDDRPLTFLEEWTSMSAKTPGEAPAESAAPPVTTPDAAATAGVPRDAARVRRVRRGRRAPLPLAAAVTTGWAAVVSLGPVLVVVFLARLASDADAQFGQVLRIGLAGWLFAHGVELRTAIGPLGLTPLALTVLAVWRVARAGVHTTRAIGGRRKGTPRVALIAAAAVAVVYGLLGAAVAMLATMPGLTVPASSAGLTLGVFGFVAALGGAALESGAHGWLARRAPLPVRDATRTGLIAALLILGAGAAAAGTSLALSGAAASKVLAAYHTGVAGQVGLSLLCFAYAPNIAIWAASYVIGPGFALGTGTVVSVAQVSLGTVPALPVLAAVPARPQSGWGGLLLAVPLAAGMAAGWLLARRRLRAAGVMRGDKAAVATGESTGPRVGWSSLLAAAALAGPAAGIALALAAWASAGPLGSGHLAQLGPRAWPLAAVAAGLVAAGAVVAAAATKVLIGGRHSGA
jgi:hypothetical protein